MHAKSVHEIVAAYGEQRLHRQKATTESPCPSQRLPVPGRAIRLRLNLASRAATIRSSTGRRRDCNNIQSSSYARSTRTSQLGGKGSSALLLLPRPLVAVPPLLWHAPPCPVAPRICAGFLRVAASSASSSGAPWRVAAEGSKDAPTLGSFVLIRPGFEYGVVAARHSVMMRVLPL